MPVTTRRETATGAGDARTGVARPPLFRALGADDPPELVSIGGQPFRRVTTFKHDSWAATAQYEGDGRSIVCKFQRRQPILGLPMAWLGRWVALHETAILQRLSGVAGIPAPLDEVVVDGVPVKNAVAREYVAGRPLERGQRLPDGFFPALETLIGELHARGVAYIDLHKRENVIVGDDGRPYLIDFQVSFAVPKRPAVMSWIARRAFKMLARGDHYHLLKHQLAFERDPGKHAAKALDRARPWWIRLHRLAAQPLRSLRRRLLVAVGIRRGRGRVETEHFAEAAVRQSLRATNGA